MSQSASTPRYVLSQRIVLDSRTVKKNAVLEIRRGRIQRILARPPEFSSVLDLGNSLLVPGLVNAHTHLELTGLSLQRPRAGRIDPWIQELLKKKGRRSREATRRGVQRGIRKCLEQGTTVVGEIESDGISGPLLKSSPLRAIVYREVLGLGAKGLSSSHRASLKRKLGDRIRTGLSPHAPFSTSPALLRATARRAGKKLPLAMHLAETRAESEFLYGKGPLFAMLSRAGKIPRGWRPPGLRPLEYLRAQGLLGTSLTLIHGNYLRSEEMRRLGREKRSVVFCPGSHRFFRHDPYPLARMLGAGIPVALGTDSLASNESLSMFREMSLVRKSHPRLAAPAVLTMATENGARALGMQGLVGALRPEHAADFVVLPPPPRGRDVWDWITASQPKVKAVYLAGAKVFP